jgi:hypothetical protein
MCTPSNQLPQEAARALGGVESANAFIAEANLSQWQKTSISKLWQHIENRTDMSRPSAVLGAALQCCATSFILVHVGIYSSVPKKPTDLADILTPLVGYASLNDHGRGTSDAQALLRHLRNGFAHCLFRCELDATTGEVMIEVADYDTKQKKDTLKFRCPLIELTKVAERLLIEACRRVGQSSSSSSVTTSRG